jgi:hypothetical protein
MESIDPLKTSVLIGIPTYDGKFLAEATSALLDFTATAQKMGMSVGFTYISGSAFVDDVRNHLAKEFMDGPYQKLLMIDADIVFTKEDILQLLYWSQKYPVVGATYPSRVDTIDPASRFFITLLPEGPRFNEDMLLECEGFGAGFLCIDRSVFETLSPHVQEYARSTVVRGVSTLGRMSKHFFQIKVENGAHKGEDLNFLKLCCDHGIIPCLDFQIQLKHVGQKAYTASPAEAFLALGWITDSPPTEDK